MPVSAHAQVSLATVVDLAQRNSTGVRAAQADVNKANARAVGEQGCGDSLRQRRDRVAGFPGSGFTGSPPIDLERDGAVAGLQHSAKALYRCRGHGLQAAKARLKDAREQVALDASTAYIELDTVNQELADAQQQEQFCGPAC